VEELSALDVHLKKRKGRRGPMTLQEPRTAAIAIETDAGRAWLPTLLQISRRALLQTGAWAGRTAQTFGSLVAGLMGPAVFSGYVLAFWSLAQNLAWTNTFIFDHGPLSNWFVWLGIAFSVHAAAHILKRHTGVDE
jgi:hypothetical protein